METKTTCPLGHDCEKAEENTLYRCSWYVQLRGKDPQSEQELDEHRCALEWLPLLIVELSGCTRAVTAATESFRNGMLCHDAEGNTHPRPDPQVLQLLYLMTRDEHANIRRVEHNPQPPYATLTAEE